MNAFSPDPASPLSKPWGTEDPARRILSRNQVRQLDRWAIESLGLPGIALMENAGASAARWLLQLAGIMSWSQTPKAGSDLSPEPSELPPFLILCGPGNNGGDGFVVARHLALAGAQVVVRASVPLDRYQGDAQINLGVAQRLGIEIHSPTSAPEDLWELPQANAQTIIVDALLGTGAVGAVRSPIREWIERANQFPCRRFALDLPSGLDADLGVVEGPIFQAHATATFAAQKPGLLTHQARPHVGQLKVMSIGI